ncbi:response regulator transcription factor [bacterium]|nr:MAG: response regulator transcription factor [bacterium]
MDRRPAALVVEDEASVRGLLAELLEAEGFRVEAVSSLDGARRALDGPAPDLVVLDRGLPDGDGLELCRSLRAKEATRFVPVLVVSGRVRVEERVVGLRGGADDYLPKPFHPAELAARARALARRAFGGATPLASGAIRLDPDRHECWVDGLPVVLWPTEFELLRTFLERPGRVLTRDFLCERVWGHAAVPTSRAVETAVQRLRRRLGHVGGRLETVRGYGFRLVEEPAPGY